MKRVLIVALILGYVLNSKGQEKWMKEGVKVDPPVCYASGEVEELRIPPPDIFLNNLKSANSQNAEIIVDYIGFPDSVKAAFQHAVDIWETLIESSVPIHISATWGSLASNVLGSCGPSTYYRDFDGAPKAGTFYPVAVVERILEREITGSSEPDMIARFNKDVEWYFGTDQNTSTYKYDFVSTVLHEIAHGLGYTGFFYADGSTGGYGLGDGLPAAYDQYVYNNSKQQLIDTNRFINPSTTILFHLTSGYLRFISPLNNSGFVSKLPRLYSPKTYDDGSSVYHLDDDTYNGSENSLMTHAAGTGESIHDPGSITMKMLADIGWKHLYIKHEELKDVEELTGPAIIEAEIKSDYALDTSSVLLFYSSNQFQTIDTMPIPFTGDGNIYRTELPVNVEQGIVSYYISATDEKNRRFTQPTGAPVNYFNLRIGPDTIDPTILHQQIPQILTSETLVEINLVADDNLGMDTVIVEYKVNEVARPPFGLVKDSATNYTGHFEFPKGDLSDGDSVKYRIIARDASSNQNITYLPEEGYFTVPVYSIFDAVDHYINDFNNSSEDFISSDFEIKLESDFDDKALHSPHPYPSPDTDDGSYNFTSILKYPIIITDGGTMKFDEVVLIEPGSTGTEYGDENFFDYVVTEGSKDMGTTWEPLADGYDSRENANWLSIYNNGVVGDNSSAVGTKDMYISRTIDLIGSGNFAVGDTILIRFRLFSDPYAHGWGWAIDNLKIQIATSSELAPKLSPGDILIYPNPFKDKINIAVETDKKLESVNVDIYNLYGQLIHSNEMNGYKSEIELKDYTSGIYLVVVKADGLPVLSKKIVKN